MTIRNRVREYRMVDPSEVAPNPRNWRTHPDRQRRALRAVLEQIGIAGAVLAYYSDRNGGQLTLIDGHERMTVGVPFPALILDVTDEEADALLATYDPIGALARVDDDQLATLFASITMPDLAAIAVDLTPLPVGTPPDAPRLDMLMLRNKKTAAKPLEERSMLLFAWGELQFGLPVELYMRVCDAIARINPEMRAEAMQTILERGLEAVC